MGERMNIIQPNGLKLALPSLIDLGEAFGVSIAPMHLNWLSEIVIYHHDTGLFQVLVKFYKPNGLVERPNEWQYCSREFVAEHRAELLRQELMQKIQNYQMEVQLRDWEKRQSQFLVRFWLRLISWWHYVRPAEFIRRHLPKLGRDSSDSQNKPSDGRVQDAPPS
jgi:hypothetical protein